MILIFMISFPLLNNILEEQKDEKDFQWENDWGRRSEVWGRECLEARGEEEKKCVEEEMEK